MTASSRMLPMSSRVGCALPPVAMSSPRHPDGVTDTGAASLFPLRLGANTIRNCGRMAGQLPVHGAVACMPSSDRASLALTARLVNTRVILGFGFPNRPKKAAVTVTERYPAGGRYSAAERGGYHVSSVSARSSVPSSPGVSRHLRMLREAGLVEVRQEAQRRVYSLRPEPLAEVDDWLGRYRSLWEQRLNALHTEVARGKKLRRSNA